METGLPTQKLNQCAYQLNGATLDPDPSRAHFRGRRRGGRHDPGQGNSFGGDPRTGAVPDTTFPYYPFIGFSSLETNLANVAGTYNQIGYHQIPSQNFAPSSSIRRSRSMPTARGGMRQQPVSTRANASKPGRTSRNRLMAAAHS